VIMGTPSEIARAPGGPRNSYEVVLGLDMMMVGEQAYVSDFLIQRKSRGLRASLSMNALRLVLLVTSIKVSPENYDKMVDVHVCSPSLFKFLNGTTE
jgi:hypothetical protein